MKFKTLLTLGTILTLSFSTLTVNASGTDTNKTINTTIPTQIEQGIELTEVVIDGNKNVVNTTTPTQTEKGIELTGVYVDGNELDEDIMDYLSQDFDDEDSDNLDMTYEMADTDDVITDYDIDDISKLFNDYDNLFKDNLTTTTLEKAETLFTEAMELELAQDWEASIEKWTELDALDLFDDFALESQDDDYFDTFLEDDDDEVIIATTPIK